MSVIEFCPVCYQNVNLDLFEHKLCDKHVKEIVEMAVHILEDPSKEPVYHPEMTCQEFFGLDLTRDVEEKVPYATVGEFMEDFGHVSVESLESLYFWRFQSRMFHVHQELKQRNFKDHILAVREILAEDEPIVSEGRGRRKRVIPDSDEDEPYQPTEEEIQTEKERRVKKRAAREAKLQAQADIDAINDDVDNDHRESVEAEAEERVDEQAKADEAIAKAFAIAKALAEKSDDEMDDFLGQCVDNSEDKNSDEDQDADEDLSSYDDSNQSPEIRLLVRIVANEEMKTTMRKWIMKSKRTPSTTEADTFEGLLRKLFCVPDCVEDCSIVRAVLSHVVSSKDFDLWKWGWLLCNCYDIPFYEGTDVMRSVRTIINFLYARNEEVYAWVLSAQ